MSAVKTTLFIGHRGVGKTSLLHQLKSLCQNRNITAQFYDLDDYIEQQTSKTITEIFNNEGEASFRQLEKKYLIELMSITDSSFCFISIGAGYKGPYPEEAYIIHVRRDTDSNGRTFLDRPRLNNNESALDEYLNVYSEREQHYQQQSHLTLTLEEGIFSDPDYLLQLLGLVKKGSLNCVYTIQNSDAKSIELIKKLQFKALELRTDKWSEQKIIELAKMLSPINIILALRTSLKNKSIDERLASQPEIKVDFALELGTPLKKYDIISSHTREGSVSNCIQKLEVFSDKAEVLKLALPINSLHELYEGHKWHIQNPQKHCFLPMSETGRWGWYRLLQGSAVFPNFIKLAEKGSARDQPYYYQWAKNNFLRGQGFACILGHPIKHSYTPSFHYAFFKKQGLPVLNIPMLEKDLTRDHLQILTQLGLKAAAVTSPLKIKMAQLVEGHQLSSVNTLINDGGVLKATNTDGVGLKALLADLGVHQNTVLWGGGGVVDQVVEARPFISCYSARTQKPKLGYEYINSPEVIIWAIGRKHQKHWPDSSWKPKRVIDLNYAEDSPGKEYALMVGAEYKSGLSMFIEQAKAQQKYWSGFLQ